MPTTDDACSHCGSVGPHLIHAAHCMDCGKKLSRDKWVGKQNDGDRPCQLCGPVEQAEDAVFCCQCGIPLPEVLLRASVDFSPPAVDATSSSTRECTMRFPRALDPSTSGSLSLGSRVYLACQLALLT